jgi:molybdate transport system regulatory protein
MVDRDIDRCAEVDRVQGFLEIRHCWNEEIMGKHKTLTVKMRIRIYVGDRMLGPGKMELLSHIGETGSLSAAAKQMGMSYMRAWTLAKELNRDRSRPMVEMSRGGARGGTAEVTHFGKQILALYQNMERAGRKAAGRYERRLSRLLT